MSEQEFETSRNYLASFVSLLTDGQSRQLGYAMDSDYYGTEDFTQYVRRELDRMTLADVNRVIRQELRTDNLQFVFVTRDADDLQRRLLENSESPIEYDADQPQDLLDEDRMIQSLPMIFGEDNVRIVPADEVFH